MGPHLALWLIALTAPALRPAELSWTAGVPLWTSLSPAGKLVDAGPLLGWASPAPAARLGTRPEPVDPIPEQLPAPRELPETVPTDVGPLLPPGAPIPHLLVTPPTVTPIAPKPEPVNPPLAVQATQRRTRLMNDQYSLGRSFIHPVEHTSEPPTRSGFAAERRRD